MNNFDLLKKMVSQFPLLPGVYLMKNEQGEILYVGKAKEIKKRVLSYLRKTNSSRVDFLMTQVHTIDYIVAKSEYEALLLEHNLIKEHQPKYNILLRDDKTFPMIKITKEEYPRVIKIRNVKSDGGEYFGPYIDVSLMNMYIDLIEKHFPLRRCNKMKQRKNPCMYYHIGRCTAVCAGLTDKKTYLARIRKIRSLLKGNTKMLKKEFTVLMHKSATVKAYERAAMYRDVIAAIESTEIKKDLVGEFKGMRNYVGVDSYNNKCCIVVVHMKDGNVVDQHISHLATFDSLEDSIEQFLISYYQKPHLFPEMIIVPMKLSAEITTYFQNYEVLLRIAVDEKDRSIIRFARENASHGLQRHIQKKGQYESVVLLQKTLSLPTPPIRIEGFDIAHVGGVHTTASLVYFYNGVPDTSQYRHFTIKSLAKGAINDFQAIQEAVSRRYTKLKNEGKSLPDLIVIDGGIGQVNSAKAILDALELSIPVIGLAKREEEIFFPGEIRRSSQLASGEANNPLQIPVNNPASQLLQAVRDEAHRFATTLRRNKQLKELHATFYTEIEGIGEKTAKKIVELFPSNETITESTSEFLAQSLAISLKKAHMLKEHVINFRKQKG